MSRPWQALIAVFGCVAVVFGIVAINKFARKELDKREHYTITIADLPVVPRLA